MYSVFARLVFGLVSALALTVPAFGQPCTMKWEAPIPPLESVNGTVSAMAVFDGELYVGGNFDFVGFGTPDELRVNKIARWDGSQWRPLGAGQVGISMGASVSSLVVWDDGTGPALYVGGVFSRVGGFTNVRNVAKWDGSSWAPLDLGVTGSGTVAIYDMAVFDDGAGFGSALYVGGSFTAAGSDFPPVQTQRIAKWDGTAWSPLGPGMGDNFVNALAVFDDDGDGPNPPALYAGGSFAQAGGISVNRIAKWDGATWSRLQVSPTQFGVDGVVNALVSHDPDGVGPALPGLYVGGNFVTVAGPQIVNRIARWGRSSPGATPGWSPVGAGFDAPVYALDLYDGTESGDLRLFAGGAFDQSGPNPTAGAAFWDGAEWTGIGTGTNGPIFATEVYDADAAGPDQPRLYVGGDMTLAGDRAVGNIASIVCTTGIPGDVNCDGVVNGFDIEPFVLALTDPDEYAVQFPECPISTADINGDGTVNGFDIEPFVVLLTGGND